MGYSNSSLATYKNISPNRTKNRNHVIDTITIHCMVAQWTAKKACDYFANPAVDASCNYAVGTDGSIGLCVEERDRSWCTSSLTNDNRAITIEVASDTTHPYKVTDKAYKALIKLLIDICKRNGIKKLVWSENKSDRIYHRNGCNMTVHRDYKNKACPGQYLYDRHGQIADEVNKALGVTVEDDFKPYMVKVTAKELNVRSGAGVDNSIIRIIKDMGTYTIIDEKMNGTTKWGLLKAYEKNRNGWISLKYTKKV